MLKTNQDWETVATFSWLPEALVVKSMLENDGIEAFIPEEHTVTVNPVMTGMIVRVQVRQKDAAIARKLIEDAEQSSRGSDVVVCPKCGSTEIETTSRLMKNIWTFIVGLVFGAPLRRHTIKGTCKKCGEIVPCRMK